LRLCKRLPYCYQPPIRKLKKARQRRLLNDCIKCLSENCLTQTEEDGELTQYFNGRKLEFIEEHGEAWLTTEQNEENRGQAGIAEK